MGELDLVNPDNLPQENSPTYSPEVESPMVDVVDNILQVTMPTEPLREYALTL